MPGLVVPGVTLTRVLGRGGFATVYAGTQVSLNRPVAVKVDSRNLDDERNRHRFLREVSAASRISNHPHAVSLVDAGVLMDARPYLVMELCEGGSVADLLATSGPLDPADALRIVAATSSALGAAHDAGVLHRDIKPGNILIDAYGTPRLSDFGIAAILREGQPFSVTLETLTPEYAPPEAFALTPPTPSADVWSMGAVLLTLLTGRSPRSDADGRPWRITEIVKMVDQPPRLDDPRIPAAVLPLLQRALHPDPAARHPNGAALCHALNEVMFSLGLDARTIDAPRLIVSPVIPRAPHATAPAERRPVGAMVMAGVAAGAVAGALLFGGVSWLMSALGGERTPVVAQAAPTASPSEAGSSSDTASPSPAPEAEETTSPYAPSPAASPSPAAVTPTQVNADGIPYSDDMPWPVGTCLTSTTNVMGTTTSQEVSCDDASQVVFAGGSIDPASSAGSATEALTSDPLVNAVCTEEYAAKFGLNTSSSYSISTMGPTDEEWAAGERGFACVFSRE
mgnify:CR=1 FL=1